MNRISIFCASAALTFAAGLASAQSHEHMQHSTTASTPSATVDAPLTAGVVKKIDKEAGKLTIQHGPILNMNMPAMTMAFKAKDAAMIDQVKPGDQINFVLERVNGTFTVTRLELTK
jgi:Cu(I)/Ag(I) efflux system protein CusF